MLKKSLFSPAQPRLAETRLSPGIVLASLRGSEALGGIFRSPRLIARANGYTKCGPYLFASSLAAALLDSLFDHPASNPALSTCLLLVDLAARKLSFSANCYAIPYAHRVNFYGAESAV
jgi:hypothetical protein